MFSSPLKIKTVRKAAPAPIDPSPAGDEVAAKTVHCEAIARRELLHDPEDSHSPLPGTTSPSSFPGPFLKMEWSGFSHKDLNLR